MNLFVFASLVFVVGASSHFPYIETAYTEDIHRDTSKGSLSLEQVVHTCVNAI